jgi:hypothetical protein
MDSSTRLNTLERWLIVLPFAGGLVFGLFPLLFPALFASLTGFSYNDPFISRLAGASTLGYAIGLALGLRQGTWAAVRLMIIAVLTFNLASIYVCIAQIIHPDTIGGARPVVYLILVTSIGFVILTTALLYRHRHEAKMSPNIASWIPLFIVIATILAAIFGLLPLFFPQLNRLFGFKATNLFLYGQAGAAALGYAVMGIFELRSRNWQELRNPFVMAAIFNGVSFLASLATIALGESLILPLLIAAASLAVTVATIIALRTNGGAISSTERGAIENARLTS